MNNDNSNVLCVGMGINIHTEQTMGEQRKRGLNDLHMGKNGENIEKDREIEQKELIEAYDKANKSGEQADIDVYKTLLFDEIFKLCKTAARVYSKDPNDTEDLYQNAVEVCLRTYENFNPHRAMVSSYFAIRIQGNLLREQQQNLPITPHYADVLSKLRTVAQDNGYSDCYDPGLDAPLLSILSSIPLKTVVTALEQGRIFVDSLAKIEEDEGEQPSTYTTSPEQMFFNNDETTFLCEMLESLSKYEKFLLQKLVMEDKPVEPDEIDAKGKRKKRATKKGCMTVNEVTKLLSAPEVYTELGLKRAPSNSTVSQDFERVKRKCLHFPGMRERYAHYKYRRKNTETFVEYEQASFAEIESAIMGDVLQEF